MAIKTNTRVYVDLEYCYPGMSAASGRPSDADLRQIIQIAAIKYDHDANREIGAFDVLVQPPYTKLLPKFFVQLTGITQKQVDRYGLNFIQALNMFINFSGSTDIYTFDKDWYVLRQNCTYYDMNFPFEHKPFSRIKSQLNSWGLPEDKYSSGTLYQAAKLTLEGRVHNALHDVRSMAAATHFFEHQQDEPG